jgi:transposase InsO family protein
VQRAVDASVELRDERPDEGRKRPSVDSLPRRLPERSPAPRPGPAGCPNLSAYAERFVRSIKHECLRHIVPLGERHLRAVMRELVERTLIFSSKGLNPVPFPRAGAFAMHHPE